MSRLRNSERGACKCKMAHTWDCQAYGPVISFPGMLNNGLYIFYLGVSKHSWLVSVLVIVTLFFSGKRKLYFPIFDSWHFWGKIGKMEMSHEALGESIYNLFCQHSFIYVLTQQILAEHLSYTRHYVSCWVYDKIQGIVPDPNDLKG